jgi:two-component system LytT family response regulator
VVFVTAYEEHAVRAFEVEAVDDLLKPFDDQRFQQALSRAKERLWLHRAALATQLAAGQTPSRPPQPAQMLALRDGTRATFLRLDEIDWIEAQDNYVEIHAGAETWLHRETLRELEGGSMRGASCASIDPPSCSSTASASFAPCPGETVRWCCASAPSCA